MSGTATAAEEKSCFEGLWSKAPTENGFLLGAKAVSFLSASHLPTERLRTIWSLCDKTAPWYVRACAAARSRECAHVSLFAEMPRHAVQHTNIKMFVRSATNSCPLPHFLLVHVQGKTSEGRIFQRVQVGCRCTIWT